MEREARDRVLQRLDRRRRLRLLPPLQDRPRAPLQLLPVAPLLPLDQHRLRLRRLQLRMQLPLLPLRIEQQRLRRTARPTLLLLQHSPLVPLPSSLLLLPLPPPLLHRLVLPQPPQPTRVPLEQSHSPNL